MKTLAIKGDKERGNEVIALLKMLDGKNRHELEGIEVDFYYYIDTYGSINYEDCFIEDEAEFFTLDEFYKKYPYKVGDKVTLDNKMCTVIWMCWECNNIYYSVQGTDVMFTKKVTADELKLYKETNMSKKLAIKGHPTRGKEVIELLEMLGGKNCYNLNGLFSENAYYFIGGPHNNEILGGEYMFGNEKIYWFTLEEFLKKYPYKVGDKVVYTKYGDNCDDYPVIIESMKWTGTTIS